jgi:DNA polymerase (family 10)
VAQVFYDIADISQILGENRFKVIAYQNAARTIEQLSQDIYAIYEAGELKNIPGIGDAIAKKIAELLETGSLAFYEKLKTQVPAGVVDIMHIPDVGPKTAKRLWEELGITDVGQLKRAAEEGEIRKLKGFGVKSEQKILKGIELMARRRETRMPIGAARPLALEVMHDLFDAVPAGTIERMEVAGSLRRWKETIGDVDILAVSTDSDAVMAAFRQLPQAVDVLLSGERKTSIVLPSGLQVDLRVFERRHWGAALQYFTGSKQHNVALRELALKQGWSLNEYGLTASRHPELPDGTERFFDTEEALYGFLGLEWVPPELRENQGEIKAAQEHKLPRLIRLNDIQGELHGHSTWSDGRASIAEMAEAARQRGYTYWTVADHSVGLGVTGGLDGDRLQEQAKEIAEINRQYQEQGINFRLLQGIEVEILADGRLALPDEVLAALDVVVASIHSGQRQDRETITARCIAAIRNPHVDILGHPTGRLLGKRPPTELDVERVLQVCAETGTVVEINANPVRLDLKDVHARRAVELGCKIAINCDAHATDGMDIMEYGIATARRGWITAEHVVNTRPVNEMLMLLKDHQQS